MDADDLIIVSVCDHVVEPAHLLEGRVLKKYQETRHLRPAFDTRCEQNQDVCARVVGRPEGMRHMRRDREEVAVLEGYDALSRQRLERAREQEENF